MPRATNSYDVAGVPRPALALVIAAVGQLAACGTSDSDSGAAPGTGEPAPRIVKLVDVGPAVLSAALPTRSPDVVFADDFERSDWSDGVWRITTDPTKPFEIDAGALRVAVASTDDGRVLELTGSNGLAYRLVEVEPATTYRVSARVRAVGLEVDDAFVGANLWIAEMSRSGAPEEVVADGPSTYLIERHMFDGVEGEEGWREQTVLFCTSDDTRSLLLATTLAMEGRATAGAVQFDDVRVERLPQQAFWDQQLVGALAEFHRSEPMREGWRATRLVRGEIGADVRPSILLYPRDALRFRVRVPETTPVLETGIGHWVRSVVSANARTLGFRIRIDGEDVLDERLVVPESLADGRWQDRTIDLSRWAGREVDLDLTVSGDVPGLFGAPLLVGERAQDDTRPNLLLISIDTLRADYVGCYGAEGDPTPHIDALAARSTRFAHVDGQAPYTLPGHSTMLTGQFPTVHGVQRTIHALSSTRSPILARILSDRGYRTQAFTGGGFVSAHFGFATGFDSFANIDPLRQRDAAFFEQLIRTDIGALRRLRRSTADADRITRELVDEYGPERVHAWIEDHREGPFFLFVHTYTVHDYDPPAGYLDCHEHGCTSYRVDYEEHRLTRKLGWNPQPISEEDVAHVSHLYTATLRYVDDLIGDLVAKLEALGLMENTVIALTTDHGEELFERGFRQHGKTLYEELTNLPMIVYVPGREPRVVEEPAMLVDLTPTVLSALGVPRDPRMQGADLLSNAPSAERVTWSEIHDDFVHKYALRIGNYKLIHAPEDPDVDFPAAHEWQLFDLEHDAGEQHDLSESDPAHFEELRALLDEHRDALRALAGNLESAAPGEMDESTLNQLRELGYIE